MNPLLAKVEEEIIDEGQSLESQSTEVPDEEQLAGVPEERTL